MHGMKQKRLWVLQLNHAVPGKLRHFVDLCPDSSKARTAERKLDLTFFFLLQLQHDFNATVGISFPFFFPKNKKCNHCCSLHFAAVLTK